MKYIVRYFDWKYDGILAICDSIEEAEAKQKIAESLGLNTTIEPRKVHP